MRKPSLAFLGTIAGSLLGLAIWALSAGHMPFGGAMLGLALICVAAIALLWARR